MGKSERVKGLNFERWIANKLKRVFPKAMRHLEFQKENAMGYDLTNTGDYLIQCKAYKRYAPITCLKEVKTCPITGGIPVLVTKGDRQEPVAVLYFSDFINLLEQASNGKNVEQLDKSS